MYLPASFREDDPAVFRRIVCEYPFATLVTNASEGPCANHLPFVYQAERGPLGALLAHVARANPVWRTLEAGGAALVVFQGPHAYVSPSWYAERLSVPTWNYVAAHAYGHASILDEANLRRLLATLVDAHEERFEEPWSMSVLPPEYTADMLREIVGFRIELDRFECKLKLSQNRQPEDQLRVERRLATDEGALSRETAAWMTDRAKR